MILAGGSGTRLWPLSREQYPKQFLKFGDYSLFQDTILRCLELSDISEVFIVTNSTQKFFVLGQIEELGYEIPEENVLLEPEGKNTLPAITFGMKEIEKKFGESIVGIFSSDHVLDHTSSKTISNAEQLATEYLVTFGVSPTHPHTGYGYIKPAEVLGCGCRVLEFREKPDIEIAKIYIEEGCLWNSGMFLFNTEVFFSELKSLAPEIYTAFFENSENDDIAKIYPKISSISVDYGIMEKSDRVAVVKLEHRWSDLGNFSAIHEEFKKDEYGNCINDCDSILIDSCENIIYSKPEKVVSLIDVKDMAIIDTKDALLVCPKESSQKVKAVVSELKTRNDERALNGQTVYRPWGIYNVLEKSDRHNIKKIVVKPGHSLSLQMHHHRSEHWVVVKGMACVQINGDKSFVRPGESTFIRAGEKHRLSNPGKISLEIIEVQIGELVEESDIVRFEDVYGRK
ncbi:Mannose-1-phosphate guanylyltransferase (GDP) [Methanosarcina siciliae C2J]|uniref:mannose-1-phosphate guanylyltransferase n=1 Tax=Methanosarcina siciliae C2J TaxID=1434118 RepID=A0A0E3PTF8_9EURY|nr:mannose-1-phosphate guanylyltransferase/mannose-6-phosphate isomerase [Methanosarcina siciliae]AKB38762.1 Mannose-1-phosphate guanylyltransferase (GDP) [Methanosarcina siciliae C2J]